MSGQEDETKLVAHEEYTLEKYEGDELVETITLRYVDGVFVQQTIDRNGEIVETVGGE